MKIIDKTPLVDEKGTLTLMQRIQGMLQFGFNWPRELEAQTAIIKYFDRQLEKGYTLIRNMSLGQSGIMIPMILLGPTGIYVIEITHLRGRYEARGEAWNVESGDAYKPAPVNLIQQTLRKAAALRKFIERQGVTLPVGIDPVIIAADPGLHIESNRPAIKVMMIDGIKAFVSGLVAGKPVLNGMQVNDYTERILNPRPRQEMAPPPVAPQAEPEPRAAWEEMYGWQEEQPQQDGSRARAIFDASNEVQPFSPEGFDFAVAEEEAHASGSDIPPVAREASLAQPVRRAKPKQGLMFGLTPMQLAVIGGLAVALLCILAIFAYVAFF